MSKFRSTILIIGLLIITVAAALLSVLVLYVTGTIKTDPIELVYSVESDFKTYDGTPLTLADDKYKLVSGSLLEGHAAQVKIIGSQTDAGESETTLEVKIFDEKGFDVSDGYAVKVNTGTLTVEKQDLSVEIKNPQVVYNGKEVFFDDYNITKGTLVKGHKIAGTNASGLEAGSLSLDVQPLIYDAFDNDVTGNYNIDFKAEDVEIVQRPLTVRPKDVSKVYDGTALKATDYEIVSGSLAPGQTIEYSIVTETGSEAAYVDCTGDLGIRIMFGTFAILDEDKNDVTANYDCNYQDAAILKVEKRPITLSTQSQIFTYNGEAQFNDSIQMLSGSLAPNQIIAIAERATVTDVEDGKVANKPKIGFSLTDGTEVSESNYSITWAAGTLSVAPLNITVNSKPFTKVYSKDTTLGDYIASCVKDGEELYTTNINLPDIFTIDASYDSIKNKKDVEAGTYSLVVKIYKDDEDCSPNFNITVNKAQYSITKQPVEIALANISNYYTYSGVKQADITAANALNSKAIGLDIADYGLTYADFKIIQPEGFINADTYTYSAELNTEPANYEIIIKDGTAVIKKQQVTLSQTVTTLTTTYNGTDNYYDEQELLKLLRLGTTDYEVGSVDFEKTYQLVKGSLANSFQTMTVKRVLKVYKGAEDITPNLDIKGETVSFKIQWKERQLDMNFREYTWTSTPDDVDLTSYVSVSGNTPLASGDTLFIEETDSGYITSTSSYYWISGYCIKNAAGDDVTHLYTHISEDKCGYGYKV